MIEGLPADSPPKLVMSILPRLRQQNAEILALLLEQNEPLRRGALPVVDERESPCQGAEGPYAVVGCRPQVACGSASVTG
jgi:hypothetical protein